MKGPARARRPRLDWTEFAASNKMMRRRRNQPARGTIPLEATHMKRKDSGILLDSEGKGFLGCMAAIVLFAALVFAAVKAGPVYYANYQFEEDLKTLTSQAGSRFIGDDKIAEDIRKLAKKRSIDLGPEDSGQNIQIERFAGQIHITVRYSVPVDFLVMKKDLKFQIRLSSFTAA